ncbi:MAG: helix-turn-helix domain-containing protein [Raineya sp.]|jgi:transcriptional regulator with XRE-family HTH domain|nr:helix-turn-helix domain-containing protein [Raineya sp.]
MEQEELKIESSLEENKDNELSERIKIIIDLKELQPSKFADEIGVQRPNMSHIIAGRNKPGLDFLHKIVKRYPEVNINWLLSGLGEPLFNWNEPKGEQEIEEDSENSTTFDKEKNKNVKKEIEKIVVFYTDKTFETFESFKW